MGGGFAPGDRSGGRTARARAWTAGILLAAAVLAAPRVGRARAEPRPIAPEPPAAAMRQPPGSGMSLEQAYAAASQLVGSRRHLESLPYFRRMIELLPEDDWSLHHDFASALQGASMQGRSILGLEVRATRSSFESIELMHGALQELDRAQRLARSPRAAATVHLARARQLGAWGLPWDALSEARAAAEADRSWPRAAQAARQWTRRISGPDFSLSPDADPGASSSSAGRAPAPERGERR